MRTFVALIAWRATGRATRSVGSGQAERGGHRGAGAAGVATRACGAHSGTTRTVFTEPTYRLGGGGAVVSRRTFRT